MNVEQKNTNPLLDFTRQITTFVTLPSKGYFNTDHNSEIFKGEIGIKPMTASDEITLTMPEALLNGESLITVIKSCVPSVINPRTLSIPDIDALIVGIRLASYGENMEVSSNCPKCDHTSHFDAPLTYCLENIKSLKSEYKVTLSEKTSSVIVSLKPYTYEQNITEELYKFNESKALNLLVHDDFNENEDMKIQYNKIIQNISNNAIENVANAILNIYTEDGNNITGTFEQIVGWVKELPINDANTIISAVKDINGTGIDKEIQLVCEECQNKWTSQINFDPSHFFDNGS